MADQLQNTWRPLNFERRPTNSNLDNDPGLDKRQASYERRIEIMPPLARKSSPERSKTTDHGDSRLSMSKTTNLLAIVDPRKLKLPHLCSNSPKHQASTGIGASATVIETTVPNHDTTKAAELDEATSLLANSLAASHKFNRLQDRRASLEKDLGVCNEELGNAMRFPHQVLTEQVQTRIKQKETLLRTIQNDLDEASKKRDFCLQLVSEKFIGASGERSGDMTSETELHLLRQQIEQERQDRIAQELALRAELHNLQNLGVKQRQTPDSLYLTSEEVSKRMQSLELSLKSELQTITKQQSSTYSATMNDLTTMNDRIEAMSKEMKSRAMPKFLKHSDLDFYIDNFERFKSTTLQRITDLEACNEKLTAELQQLRSSQSGIQELKKDFATLSTEFSKQQKNRNTASLTDADRQTLEQAKLLVQGLNGLGRQTQELLDNARRTNHSIMALNSKCDSMTTESFYKKIMQMCFPSLEDIRGKTDATSDAIRALDKRVTDTISQVAELGKDLSLYVAATTDLKSQISEVHRFFDIQKQDTSRLEQQLTKANSSDEVNALRQDFAAIQKQVSSLEDQVHNVSKQIQAVPGTILSSHQTCLANNIKLMADVKAAKQLLEARVDALEQENSTIHVNRSPTPPEVYVAVSSNDQPDDEDLTTTQSIAHFDEGNVQGARLGLSTTKNRTSVKPLPEDSTQKRFKKNKHKKRTRADSGHTIVVQSEQRPKKKAKTKATEPIDLTLHDDSDTTDDFLVNKDADGIDAEDVETLLRKFKRPNESPSKHQVSEQKKKKPSKRPREL